MKNGNESISRRHFINRGIRSASALALTAAAGSLAARTTPAATAGKANPFAYEVDRVIKTDPKLIQYEETSRFACSHTEPRRITTGPEDRLYIAASKYVTVLDGNGSKMSEITLAAPARCVAVAGDGTIYVGVRDHIEVFNREGQRQVAWESPGKKTWFTGMSVGEKDVFVADAGNRLILRYDRSGKLVGRIGEKNKERNVPGLIVPSPYLDVELARDGLLRVNNPGRHCVEAYTVNGEFELSWGKPSAAIDGFCGCCNPIGLAMLPDGRCITCEKGLPRTKIYSADGTFECVVAGPESFPENSKAGSVRDLSDGSMGGLDAAVDSHGRIYILDIVAANVRVMKRKA